MKSGGSTRETCCSILICSILGSCVQKPESQQMILLSVLPHFLSTASSASASHSLYSCLEGGFGKATWSCYMAIPSQLPLLNHHLVDLWCLMVLWTCSFVMRSVKEMPRILWWHLSFIVWIFFWSSAVRVHVLHAYRKIENTNACRSLIVYFMLMVLSIPVVFNFASTLTGCADLMRISCLNPSSLMLALRYLNWWTVSRTMMSVVMVLSLLNISLIFSA